MMNNNNNNDEIATLEEDVRETEGSLRKLKSRVEETEESLRKMKSRKEDTEENLQRKKSRLRYLQDSRHHHQKHQQEGIIDKIGNHYGEDIQKAIRLLRSKEMNFVQVMERFDGGSSRRLSGQTAFWSAFLEVKNDLPRFKIAQYVHKGCFSDAPTVGTQDWTIYMDLGKYDPALYWHFLRKSGGLVDTNWTYIVPVFAERNPLSFLKCVHDCDNSDFFGHFPHVFVSIVEQLPLQRPDIEQFLMTSDSWFPQAEAFWHNREVVMAWGSAGGTFLTDKFPAELKNDAQVLLAFVGNTTKYNRPPVQLGDDVRANKDVMLKLIRSNPDYLQQIADELVGDMDLLVAALSDEHSWCYQLVNHHWYENGESINDFWIRVTNVVRERLKQYDVFVNVILPLMELSTKDSSPISLLNQGKETLQKYETKIAEFIGVPLGEELSMLRSASKALALRGYYTWDD